MSIFDITVVTSSSKRTLLVGYDISQLRLSGKFSHKPSDQRVLQFNTQYRDLDDNNRVYVGASSKIIIEKSAHKYEMFQMFAENYSIYGVEIVLTRVLSPYILSVYLPSAMFVVMSWVSKLVLAVSLQNNLRLTTDL